MLEDFKKFIFRGNVIDLAVAVIIGAAFSVVVNSLVQNILMPIIGILFGKPNFDQALVLTINDSQIRFGAFLTVLVTVVLTAMAVFFFIVKPYDAYRERRHRAQQVAPAPTEVQLLAEIRDAIRAR